MKPKHQKQREAQERQAERDDRTDAEQLSRLTRAGHGHCKEARRLHERERIAALKGAA